MIVLKPPKYQKIPRCVCYIQVYAYPNMINTISTTVVNAPFAIAYLHFDSAAVQTILLSLLLVKHFNGHIERNCVNIVIEIFINLKSWIEIRLVWKCAGVRVFILCVCLPLLFHNVSRCWFRMCVYGYLWHTTWELDVYKFHISSNA